mgnify:CR=1 FL=1
MEMTPQEIAGTTFRVVKKGFDPEEVRAFQVEAARALDEAQNQASLMEQRARAAVAKAQGLRAAAGATMAQGAEPEAAPQAVTSDAVASDAVASHGVTLRADDAEIISRTLVLAQRTAEHTIADATREASEVRAAAQAEARDAVDQARVVGATLVADVRLEARRAGEAERAKVDNEIQALLARLDNDRVLVSGVSRGVPQLAVIDVGRDQPEVRWTEEAWFHRLVTRSVAIVSRDEAIELAEVGADGLTRLIDLGDIDDVQVLAVSSELVVVRDGDSVTAYRLDGSEAWSLDIGTDTEVSAVDDGLVILDDSTMTFYT